jgi:N-acetylglutamate synthase-like GNAT family acetyltransferase
VTDSSQLRVRRATVDDLPALKSLWQSMRLSPDELEKRLTEFQIVEDSERHVLGAIGIQFSKHYALLHSEGYSDFAIADAARQLFWERIQTLAANHGVFRIWTQERSPFWKSFGFQPPNAETVARLPEQWRNEFSGAWLTFQLKNEEVISAAIEKHFAVDPEKKAALVSEKTRTINTVIIVAGLGIFFICMVILIYLFMRRNPFSP